LTGDAEVFSPLKTAFREQVERVYRGCVAKAGIELFASLYGRARDAAFTPQKIRAGWAKSGLIPLNPDMELRGLQRNSMKFQDLQMNRSFLSKK